MLVLVGGLVAGCLSPYASRNDDASFVARSDVEPGRGGATNDTAPVERTTANDDAQGRELRDTGSDESAEIEPADGAIAKSRGAIDLAEALRIALDRRPDLAALRSRLVAAAAEVDQAGRWPNPRIEGIVDTAPLDRDTLSEAEYLIGLVQTIPIGGRVGESEGVAAAARAGVELDVSAAEREIIAKVEKVFQAALWAREVVAMRREILVSVSDQAERVRLRRQAGDASEEDVRRAEIEVENARLELEEAEAEEAKRRIALAEAIGLRRDELGETIGELPVTITVPPVATLAAAIARHPTLLRARASVAERQAELALAEAERIPDLEVGVYYRRVTPADLDAFDLVVGVPLPIFDLNSGNIRAAEAMLAAARAELESRELALSTEAEMLRVELESVARRLARYQEELLPRSRELVGLAGRRYELGESSFTDLLLAQERHARLRIDYLETALAAAMAQAELRALLAD